MKYQYVLNLDDHESSGITTKYRYNETGTEVIEEMSAVQDGEGEHMLYNVTDTVMSKVPTDSSLEKESEKAHEHSRGYETFFIDSGIMYVYIDGVRVKCTKGDILQLQPLRGHAMVQEEDVKFRGFFHDLDSFNNGIRNFELYRMMPDSEKDPEFTKLIMGKDFFRRAKPIWFDVPTEQCSAIKNPNRPMYTFDFEGAKIKIIVPRWENGNVCECICAEMEPGFTVNYDKYPKHHGMYYVRNGKVKITINGEDHIATTGCLVNAPIFVPRRMVALEKSEVYEVHALTQWFSFLLDYSSIKKYNPQLLDDPATLKMLKEKFDCDVESIGMSKL